MARPFSFESFMESAAGVVAFLNKCGIHSQEELRERLELHRRAPGGNRG